MARNFRMEYIYNYRLMRKLSLILLIACLASACIKETPAGSSLSGNGRAISFMTATYTPGTKTDPETYTGGVYNTSETFGVYAFTLDNNNYGIETSREFGYVTSTTNDRYPDLMYNDGVAYNSTSGTWSPILRDYFWPKQNRVAFFAYSPFYPYVTNSGETDYPDYKVANSIDKEAGHDGYGRRAASFNVSTDNSKQHRFYHYLGGVTIGNNVPGGNNDLLYSDIALNFNDFADGSDTDIVSNGTDATFNGVPILFHHAFCKINFAARLTRASDTEGLAEEDAVEIPSIEGEQHVSSSDTKTLGISGGNPQYEYDYSEFGKVVVTKKYWHTVVDVYTQKMTTTKIWGTNTYTGKVTSFTLSKYGNKGDLHLRSPRIDDPSDAGYRSRVIQWDMDKSKWDVKNTKLLSKANITLPVTPAANPASVSVVSNQIVIPQKSFDANYYVSVDYQITTDPERKEIHTYTTTTTVTRQLQTTTVRVYSGTSGSFPEALAGEDEPGTWEMVEDERNTQAPVDHNVVDPVSVPVTVEDAVPKSGYQTTLTFKTGNIPLSGLGGISSWDMGKIYTYTFNISPKAGQKITWDPAMISEWTTGSATLDL